MTSLLILAVLGPKNLDPTPFIDFYRYDSNATAILPWFVKPRAVGGWWPAPDPPPECYIRQTLPAERLPGDQIVRHVLEREVVKPPRNYRGVGQAVHWEMTFRCDLIGPSGLYTVYVDKSALVRVP